MTHLTIQQSDQANIISFPRDVLKTLHLPIGAHLKLDTNRKNQIILTREEELLTEEPLTLEKVLAGSPQKNLKLKKEDREWLQAKDIGREA